MSRRGTTIALTLCLLASGVAHGQPASIAPASHRPAERLERFEHPVPAGLEAPGPKALWRRGIAAEEREAFGEAVEIYTLMADETPALAYPYWKVARNLWRHGEALPVDAKTQRMDAFREAKAWASRGLARDPDCAECMLWKFGAMGRIATTRGLLASLRAAPEMHDLLERGVELQPTFADSAYNTALGNLYYASAVFYRLVPEWRWLGWMIGVRGDMDRSLEMIRAAVAVTPSRIDYNVELGAILGCYAERRNAAWARAESRRVLSGAAQLPIRMDQDPLDLEHAATLLREPGKACGYSRDGWIDTDAERKLAEAGS